MLWQPSLPDVYLRMTPDELAAAIAVRRRELGESLFILGHHYQTDEVIRHADATGDSLKLSQIAADIAARRPVKYVVFCGVHFMAESADMLTPEHVSVLLPDLSAGCSMADMAQYDDTVEAWDAIHEALHEAHGGKWIGRIVPITYVNSSAAIKAFVGAHGGACCTSSNAQRVFGWALAQQAANGPEASDDVRILFLPDQHLGRNTACTFGLDPETDMCVYDPRLARRGEQLGGATREQIVRTKVVLWAGHCSVHKLFRPEHCDHVRAEDAANPGRPPTTILVHPECCKEVVDKADLAGSTEFIIQTLREAKPGSRWAVGTEVHLVNRLAREMAGRKDGAVDVRILSDCQCLCTTMYRIDEPHLLWTLDNLAGVEAEAELASGAAQSRFSDLGRLPGKPRVVNQIRVHPDVRRDALLALERMLKQAESLVMVD
ncbi:MAG: quinolinate synthase NadA [Phycisphaerales bacterium]|nr:quinolinate synthase NadA [Phycisphaerales bacterium]MCB9840666.1 quinolinate synthase NadA [Phycisphaeraceae bacterium]